MYRNANQLYTYVKYSAYLFYRDYDYSQYNIVCGRFYMIVGTLTVSFGNQLVIISNGDAAESSLIQ